MHTLPLTVLVHEGPNARAYLMRLRRLGLRPSAIVLLVSREYPGTKKEIPGWLPSSLKMSYAQRVQESAEHYWPRHIRKAFPALFEAMRIPLEAAYGEIDWDEMLPSQPYESYADSVERVFIRDFRDPALYQALLRLKYKTLLFTGGGLVPAALLSIPGIRFLHVHPGTLPFVRGADGLLWSILTRGFPGASCFYMQPGLDMGDVIETKDLPNIVFPLRGIKRPPDPTLYRALFSYYDPLLRADFLAAILAKSKDMDLANLSSSVQELSVGITYHFMHEKLRHRALQKLFPSYTSV
ncbi:MAG: hypothetical protein A2849_01170 [Candidatus Taylorbacteria bacterium RIFCSPHIGHO2_01_FULL_51_15]|uniref:Formyl transferase N-terminal domain-containing protein n=1 Tax=Candidatus Taylorbacteria bacterium RIFCSPHIGHO2_01_FULL_51_15 TaxID=1802304 RepID=A0A1G2M902_9BACT|nr:MAG: hypothetical protein A2849_01170 [Candidatus Taylorbacteria bacterium RIFCSPHIGHO2_01_FULL_51_15]